jgi:hypothetical protein
MPESGFHSIKGVEKLFDVILHGNHQHGLAEIRRLADGFKAGRADHRAAFRHHFQKFFPVQLVESQTGKALLGFRRAGFIVKTMHGNRRIGRAPAFDIRRVTMVQQIHQKKITAPDIFQFKELAAQDWRADEYFFVAGTLSAA